MEHVLCFNIIVTDCIWVYYFLLCLLFRFLHFFELNVIYCCFFLLLRLFLVIVTPFVTVVVFIFLVILFICVLRSIIVFWGFIVLWGVIAS